jgi:hypothetical protein
VSQHLAALRRLARFPDNLRATSSLRRARREPVQRRVRNDARALRRFPQPRSIVYRFTRDAARHEAAIKRLVSHPDRVRTATVAYTLRQLQALADQVRRDLFALHGFLDGYGDAGFLVRRVEVEAADGVVDVEVVSARADAAAYFAARYGPLVRVAVAGDRHECSDSYR